MNLDSFSYVQKEEKPHGKVILIGMLEDGPTGNPFVLIDEDSATPLLGDNETTRAYNLLIESGVEKEDIYLFRLNGIPAQATIKINDEVLLTLQSLSSHTEEQRITFVTSKEGVAIKSDYSEDALKNGTRRNFRRTYRFDDYPYLSNLAEAITKDAMLGMHGVIAESHESKESNTLAQSIGENAFLYGDEEASLIVTDGEYPESNIDTEGTYLNSYWNKFYVHVLGEQFDGESSSKLIDIASEVMYFPDVPIDEVPEIAILAARAAEYKSNEQGLMCSSLFRTNPVPRERVLSENEYMDGKEEFYNEITDEVEIWEPLKEKNEFIKKLKNLFTEEEKDFPEMKHLQIVVGDNMSSNRKLIPGANYHLIHLLNQQLVSTTNKELTFFDEVNSPLDKIDIDKLNSNGYICIVESIRRNVVTSKVKSMFNEISYLDDFYYQKILSYITYDIRSMLDTFIGDSISRYNEVELNELFEDYLDQYIEAGMVQSFSLGEREEASAQGIASVKINLVMYGQVESVKGAIQLNEAGWEVDLWNL